MAIHGGLLARTAKLPGGAAEWGDGAPHISGGGVTRSPGQLPGQCGAERCSAVRCAAVVRFEAVRQAVGAVGAVVLWPKRGGLCRVSEEWGNESTKMPGPSLAR